MPRLYHLHDGAGEAACKLLSLARGRHLPVWQARGSGERWNRTTLTVSQRVETTRESICRALTPVLPAPSPSHFPDESHQRCPVRVPQPALRREAGPALSSLFRSAWPSWLLLLKFTVRGAPPPEPGPSACRRCSFRARRRPVSSTSTASWARRYPWQGRSRGERPVALRSCTASRHCPSADSRCRNARRSDSEECHHKTLPTVLHPAGAAEPFDPRRREGLREIRERTVLSRRHPSCPQDTPSLTTAVLPSCPRWSEGSNCGSPLPHDTTPGVRVAGILCCQ